MHHIRVSEEAVRGGARPEDSESGAKLPCKKFAKPNQPFKIYFSWARERTTLVVRLLLPQ